MVRIKHRYIIAQVICDDETALKTFSIQDILNANREKLAELFGDIGFGLHGKNMTLKYYDPDSSVFILRVPREAETQVRLAIACMHHIKKAPCISRTLEICGSERTCKEKIKKLLIKLAETKYPGNSELFQAETAKITKTVNQLDL